jgi:hypothetical protein
MEQKQFFFAKMIKLKVNDTSVQMELIGSIDITTKGVPICQVISLDFE